MPAPESLHYGRLDAAGRFAEADPHQLHRQVESTVERGCRDAAPEEFFPADGTRFSREALLEERDRIDTLCRSCPVREECLAAALLRGEIYGGWGGLTQPDYQVVQRLWRQRKSDRAA
ncbi:hypothetical protein [Alloactinosynnema sp. L-07]|uniref:WhiB family transcriptional regulator n=1 Tax=Alloactinosynnema sp. L-07 TaxID=1653480 RepID=UPI00065F02D9|nr:WhiB family transcriptional regulator [Alloactinosynnema sp. L-07]CRK56996.1 hypothetical protein [Alloactinosynnema sp. L-07]